MFRGTHDGYEAADGEPRTAIAPTSTPPDTRIETVAQPIVDTAQDTDEPSLTAAAPDPAWRGGRSLHELADLGPLPWTTVARVGAAAAAALAELHADGHTHGAVRPETVVACADGQAWIVDPVTAASIPARRAVRTSPEVARELSATPATDVFDLAVALLGLLGLPNDTRRVTSIDDADLPTAARQVLMGMLAERPDARLDAATAAGRLDAAARRHPSSTSDDGVVVALFPDADRHAESDEDRAEISLATLGLTALATPLAPQAATPRRLGILALSAVTILFAAMFTFASPAPEQPTDADPLVAIDGGVAAASAAP